jgi:hypothetical protein
MTQTPEIVGYRIYSNGAQEALVSIDAAGVFEVIGAEHAGWPMTNPPGDRARGVIGADWRLVESMSRFEWERRQRRQRCTVCGGADGYCSACWPAPPPERPTW